MDIALSSENRETIQRMIDAGTYACQADVLNAAIDVLRRRDELRREIRAGQAEAEAGHLIAVEEVFAEIDADCRRDDVYRHLLHFGLLALRDASHVGDITYCRVESEHLHNLPSLIGETNTHRHDFYFLKERTAYLEAMGKLSGDYGGKPAGDYGAIRRRYEELWRELETIRNGRRTTE